MTKKLIELVDVNYKVQNKSILENISFDVSSGEVVTIIGPNGAGKSTLIKVVIGLLTPTVGTIKKCPQLSIGYVPQKLKFEESIPLTVDRFLRLNRPKHKEYRTILEKVQAEHLIHYDMSQLSGGEMQKILFAHALLKQPDLLILDEPAQGLDLKSQGNLYEMLASTVSELNCGVLLVSHDLHLVAKNTDKVICLNQSICCIGSPKSLENEPKIAELFGTNIFNQVSFYPHHHHEPYKLKK